MMMMRAVSSRWTYEDEDHPYESSAWSALPSTDSDSPQAERSQAALLAEILLAGDKQGLIRGIFRMQCLCSATELHDSHW